MTSPSTLQIHKLRPEIVERRTRLLAAANSLSSDYINELLAEVDATLQRIDAGKYGLCEVCHDPIEPERLEHDPMVRFCLDHLTPDELKAHQQDLSMATQIQAKLLPPMQIMSESWDICYRYEPVGAVGGDYCEVVNMADGELFFAVGDVAGKGVAASLLMTHLSAIFRSLISLDLPLSELISRANRLFCDSTTGAHYATLACGRTVQNGMELCNAGHCRPLLLRQHVTERVEPTGLPLGLFCTARYDVSYVSIDPGESLVLYTDGLTEARDSEGNEYGEDGLVGTLQGQMSQDLRAIADGVLRHVTRFRAAGPPVDDATLLVIRRR